MENTDLKIKMKLEKLLLILVYKFHIGFSKGAHLALSGALLILRSEA